MFRRYIAIFTLFVFGVVLGAYVPPHPEVHALACASPTWLSLNMDQSVVSGNDVEVVDLDEDGDLDFVVTSQSANDIYWFSNDGDGSFTANGIADATLSNINSLFVIDLDEDTDLDIVAASSTNGKVYWLENDGSESFTGAEVGNLTDARDVVAGNLNGAGGLDIAAVGFSSDEVYLFANDGSESFTGSSIASLDGPLQITINDIDEDGDNDLVASAGVLTTGGTKLYLNNGSGVFSTTSINTLNDTGSTVGDIDSDGDRDIVSLRGAYTIHFNDGSESFTDSNYTFTNGQLSSPRDVHIVDVDDDGDNDMIMSAQANGWGWLENDGSENFTDYSIVDDGNFHESIDSGDFDNDGYLDLVGVKAASDNPVVMYQRCDASAPSVFLLSPTDDATEVEVDSNIVINFSENVDVESGNVTIKKSSDDTTFEAIDVTSGQVTGTGTGSITINPSSDLSRGTSYYVQVDATAFDDAAGNSFAGISDSTTWNFTTVGGGSSDTSPPTISSTSGFASPVSLEEPEFSILFSEEVYATRARIGDVSLFKKDSSELVKELDFDSFEIWGWGGRSIYLSPDVELEPGTEYYFTISFIAFHDDRGNYFEGVNDDATLAFTTQSLPEDEVVEETVEEEDMEEVEDLEEAEEQIEYITVEELSFDAQNKCSDLVESHWAQTLISELLENELYPVSDGGFCLPDDELTREMLVAWMVSMSHASKLDSIAEERLSAIPFSDVELDSPFAAYILIAYEQGIVEGYPDGSFKPGNVVTRAEAIKILWHSHVGGESELNFMMENDYSEDLIRVFDDEKEGDAWYYPYLYYAVDNSWVEGRELDGVRNAAMNSPVLYSEFAKLLSLAM